MSIRWRSRITLVAVTALITLLAGALIAYFLGYLSKPAPRIAEQKGKTAATSGEKEKKILYWRSPMDPAEIYDKPGKDKMGMDLVPVYATQEAGGPPGTVTIDPATIQNIGVKTVIVQRKSLTREIRTVGRVAYNEETTRQISPRISGWVERQYVNFPGQVVEKGQRLLEIYSPDLVSTQEEYLVALRAQEDLRKSSFPEVVTSGRSLAHSAEQRLRLWGITEEQIKALRERGKVSRTMVLHAPFKGIVLKKDVPEGGYVQAGQNLYGIADISTVWVYAEVYEYEAPWLKLGQTAEMNLSYQPGASYHGKVAYIYPYLQNSTRTLQVRMVFPNTERFILKPDMWANVTLRSDVARMGLAVPIEAVIRTGKRNIALIALERGRFAPRDLRLGPQVDDEFEVLDGLKEGERVVTSAQFLIYSESNLQSALGKMMETKPEGGGKPPSPAPSGGKQGMPGMPGM